MSGVGVQRLQLFQLQQVHMSRLSPADPHRVEQVEAIEVVDVVEEVELVERVEDLESIDRATVLRALQDTVLRACRIASKSAWNNRLSMRKLCVRATQTLACPPTMAQSFRQGFVPVSPELSFAANPNCLAARCVGAS